MNSFCEKDKEPLEYTQGCDFVNISLETIFFCKIWFCHYPYNPNFMQENTLVRRL